MSKKKLGMASIEVNKKFANEEEVDRYAKNLITAIRYICNKKAEKGWFAQAMVVSSNLMKGVSLLEYERTGKIGRPPKVLRIDKRTANDWYKGNYKTDWHLHILIVAKPIYAFRDEIKAYIDKNWGKLLTHNINGIINDNEFKERNDSCNNKINSIQNEIDGIKEEETKANNMEEEINKLEALIESKVKKPTDEMLFDLLDKIVVYSSEDKCSVKLKIYLKIGKEIEANYINSKSQHFHSSYTSRKSWC